MEPTRSIAVTAFLDGRDWRLELGQHTKLKALQENNLEGQVDFFASGQSADELASQGRFQQQHPALAMLGCGFSQGFSRQTYRSQGKAKVLRAQVMENLGLSSWEGRRSFSLGDTQAPSDGGGLRLGNYPGRTHVVLVSGHYQDGSLAGLSMSEMGRALARQPVDLFVSDGCCLANLEALRELPESVGVVVASEHRGRLTERLLSRDGVVFAEVDDGLPLERTLPAWKLSPEPVSMAKALVKAGAANPRTGFTAIDMKAFHQSLLPAVRDLGQKLAHADKKAVNQLPRVDELLERVDLGRLLQVLAASDSEEVRAAAHRAQQALGATVLEKVNPLNHAQDSGLSVSPQFWRSLA